MPVSQIGYIKHLLNSKKGPIHENSSWKIPYSARGPGFCFFTPRRARQEGRNYSQPLFFQNYPSRDGRRLVLNSAARGTPSDALARGLRRSKRDTTFIRSPLARIWHGIRQTAVCLFLDARQAATYRWSSPSEAWQMWYINRYANMRVGGCP